MPGIPLNETTVRTLPALSLGLRSRESGQLSTIIPQLLEKWQARSFLLLSEFKQKKLRGGGARIKATGLSIYQRL